MYVKSSCAIKIHRNKFNDRGGIRTWIPTHDWKSNALPIQPQRFGRDLNPGHLTETPAPYPLGHRTTCLLDASYFVSLSRLLISDYNIYCQYTPMPCIVILDNDFTKLFETMNVVLLKIRQEYAKNTIWLCSHAGQRMQTGGVVVRCLLMDLTTGVRFPTVVK